MPDETLFLQRLKEEGRSVERISFSTSPCEMPNCSLMMSKVVLSSQAISTILSFSKSLKYFISFLNKLSGACSRTVLRIQLANQSACKITGMIMIQTMF